MDKAGYVYVLINPSIPNCVKIGKTQKEPSSRAAELSSATGVPTPFIVVYKAYFEDCDAAESFVHAYLESKGLRVSQNREFFSVPVTSAINAVIEAQNTYGISKAGDLEKDTDTLSHTDDLLSDLSAEPPGEPWEEIMAEALIYHIGDDDHLENHDRATHLYKTAAKLGAPQAYLRLAQLFSDSNPKEARYWAERGAEAGVPECWLELATGFRGDVSVACVSPDEANAIKCYRKYFELIDSPLVPKNESGLNSLFFSFCNYVRMLGMSPEERDVEVSRRFVETFREYLLNLENDGEATVKTAQFRDFISKYAFLSW